MQQQQQQQQHIVADGNRNKLFAGLTKKLVSLEQGVSEKDAQLRAYQSRDAALTLELHNTTVALGQERSLLNLANATISKLEAKMQEILPQFEYHLEQNHQIATLEEQLSISNSSLDDLRSKYERLAIFKEEQTEMDSSRSVSDREMLGTLIREVQSERTRAEQTRTRILEQVTNNVYNKKLRVFMLDMFKRWKHDIRFSRKYNLVYYKSAQSHGTFLLRAVLQNWRFIWPVGKYLDPACTIRRMSPLLHSECRHGQERRCLSLRLMRNTGIARMIFRMWKRTADEIQTKSNIQHQKSGDFGDAFIKSESSARRTHHRQMDSSKCGVLILNLRVKYTLKRLLLIWHSEASIEKKCKIVSEIERDAHQTRVQLSSEMQMLQAQRNTYDGEIERLRSKSHNLVQKTVETLFGSNTKLVLQSCFNRLKNCALESRSRKIEELEEALLHVGENTAFKLLQYETAITMSRDYCVRRLLPEIAFLTWKNATSVTQWTHEADFLKARVAELESLNELLPMHVRAQNSSELKTERQQTLLEHSAVMEIQGQQHEQANRTLLRSDESPNMRVLVERTAERIHQSVSTKNRDIKDSAREYTTDDVAPQIQGRQTTLTQLASFLMPTALEQSISSSPLLGMHQPAPIQSFGDMNAHNSSLLDLQQKLSRLESRWASIRLNPS